MLDYVLPAEPEENSWCQEGKVLTISDPSTSLQVALSSPASSHAVERAVNAVFDQGEEAATGVPAVPESLLPFDSPGPSRFSLQGLDDLYS